MFLKIRNRKNATILRKNLEDEKLIKLYKERGEVEIIGELFERYTHLVFGVCFKYLKNEQDSQDVVLEIFEDLMESLKKNEVKNFKSWLYSVSKNFCLMRLRKGKTEEKAKQGYLNIFETEFVESSELLHLFSEDETNNKMIKLKKGLVKLKEEQRICIEMLYLQNKSYIEVAGETGFSMKQVKSYIQNGKRNLKNFLLEG
ncbi:MAG: sigma-70 family RNA polymerase sigma factor [Desulfobacula sp.]|nr:sigma-70 family RNA polymerase sigma factor [Desulfobacula sp.]